MEEDKTQDLDSYLDHSERIAVIGSPSSTTDLNLDVLGTAAEKKLIGSLGVIRYPQDGINNYALGQITEISMQNIWSQDPTMKSLVRQKGRVDPITGKQDTHRAKMIVSAVFANNVGAIEPSVLGTVPSTGTSVRLVDNEILKKLLSIYQQEIFYLGNIYGNNVLLPVRLRHFGSEEQGLKEAQHIGVFGKTGSGKSVLAKMITLAYSKHKSMSMFVLDPQGEFSMDLKDETSPLKKGIDKLNRKVILIDLQNLILSGYPLFRDVLLESEFFKRLQIISFQNQERAADTIVGILDGKIPGTRENQPKIAPWDACKQASFDRIWLCLSQEATKSQIYNDKKLHERIESAMNSRGKDEVYQDWLRICNLFSYNHKKDGKIIKDLIEELFSSEEKSIVVIDLSANTVSKDIFWNDNIKNAITKEFLATLTAKAEEKYKIKDNLNTLVVIDEAHRLAPRETSENPQLEELKNTLIDAVRTTRKYGLGWMFISQTLSSLHREILNQIRIFMFGFGLGWGMELRALEELIGGNREAISLYQSFKDPQSGLGKREYPFMCIGPASPLSFSSTPLFFNALNYNRDFLKINNLDKNPQ